MVFTLYNKQNKPGIILQLNREHIQFIFFLDLLRKYTFITFFDKEKSHI